MHIEFPKIVFVGSIASLWIVFYIFWVRSAQGTKRAKIRDNQWVKKLLLPAVIIISAFIYLDNKFPGILNYNLFPGNIAANVSGIFVCLLGLSFSVWARNTLGKNWSGLVELKQGHELIQTGPYSIVRHPIYTGVIIAAMGSVIVFQKWVWLFVPLNLFWGFLIKIRIEENLLCQEFPEEYPRYISKVKKLIPFLL